MRKKLVSTLAAVCLLASISPGVSAKENTFSDTSGHWAEAQIETWSQRGIVQGDGEAFHPNANITRGAVAAIIDRIMQYPTASKNTFSDLPADSYCTDSVLRLSRAGVMKGYLDGTVHPNSPVTRQEVVAMLARAFLVSENGDTPTTYKDSDQISAFAEEAVRAFSANGYVHGNLSNLFRPQDPITRAEFVKILDNMIGELMPSAGEERSVGQRLLVINQPDVTLADRSAGAIFVAPGADEGTVTLDDVKCDTLYILGGGLHSVIIQGNSEIGLIRIAKQDSGVRVQVSKGSDVEVTQILDGCDDVILSGYFQTVAIDSSRNTVKLRDAIIDDLTISGAGVDVVVEKDTEVDTLTIADSADRATVDVQGKINDVYVDNDSAKVTTSGGGSSGGGSSSGGSSGGTPGGEDKPEPPVITVFGLTITVSGGGKVYAEEIEAPVDPTPDPEPDPDPPVIDPIDPDVDGYPLIIQTDGHGFAMAEEFIEPDTPDPDPEPSEPKEYIARIQISGQGTVVIEEIGD